MRISVSIMSHPKRKIEAKLLYKQLIQYPFSDVYIIWDEKNDEWDTGSRSLRGGMVLNSDWHMVIQDDAILTPDFYNNVDGAIRNLPNKALISLYTGKVKPYSERVALAVKKATQATWLRHYTLLWGVCIVLPTDHIEPMLDFLDEPRYYNTRYDSRIGMFYNANRLPIYYTNPSLVDHNDSIGTLLPGHETKELRVAHRLATGLIKWNNQVIDI